MTTFMDFMKGYEKQNDKANTEKVTYTTKDFAKPGQIKYYKDLCAQRRLTPDVDCAKWTKQEISNKIQELLAFKPMSDKQVETLMTKLQNVSQLVAKMNFSEDDVNKLASNDDLISQVLAKLINKDVSIMNIIPKLTGGMNGSGSKLISDLIDIEKLYSDQQPPTESQIDMMVGMYLCPDVDFEKYDIERTVNLGEGLWRKMTPDEFKEELNNVLTKEKASTLLNEFRGVFYDWKNTRIRPEQMKYIRSLEGQLSTDNKSDVIEYSIDIEGNIIQNKIKTESVKGESYIPLDDEQLIMFSIEEASQFIDQLKAELSRKEGSSIVESTINDKELRFSKSIQEAVDMEYEEFNDLMFKLQAVAGYEDDELVEVANINLVADDTPEANIENRKKIRAFMKDLLETGAITFYELLELTKESITAQKILLDM